MDSIFVVNEREDQDLYGGGLVNGGTIRPVSSHGVAASVANLNSGDDDFSGFGGFAASPVVDADVLDLTSGQPPMRSTASDDEHPDDDGELRMRLLMCEDDCGVAVRGSYSHSVSDSRLPSTSPGSTKGNSGKKKRSSKTKDLDSNPSTATLVEETKYTDPTKEPFQMPGVGNSTSQPVVPHHTSEEGAMDDFMMWDVEEVEARDRLERKAKEELRMRQEELQDLQRLYNTALKKSFRTLKGMPEPNYDSATPTVMYEEELDALGNEAVTTPPTVSASASASGDQMQKALQRMGGSGGSSQGRAGFVQRMRRRRYHADEEEEE